MKLKKLRKMTCIVTMLAITTGLVACGDNSNTSGIGGTGGTSASIIAGSESAAETKADDKSFEEVTDTAPYEEVETKNGMIVKGSDLKVIYNLDDYPASFWDAKNLYSTSTNRKVAENFYNKEFSEEFGVLTPVSDEYSTYKRVNGSGYKLTLKSNGFIYMNALEEDSESKRIELHVLLNDGTFFTVYVAMDTVKESRFESEFGKVDEEVGDWTLHKTSACPILVKKLETKSDEITVLTIELAGNVSKHSKQVMRSSRRIELVNRIKECITIEQLDYVPEKDYIDVKSVDESAIKISDKVTVTVPEEFKMISWSRKDTGFTLIGTSGYGGRNIIRYQKGKEYAYITIVELPKYINKTIEDVKTERENMGYVLTDVSSGGIKMYESYPDLSRNNSKLYERIIEDNGTVYVVSCEVFYYEQYPETVAKLGEIGKGLVKISN